MIETRPKTLDEFQGQSNQDVIERLRIAIASAKKRNIALPHVLLYGSAGLGKTTLSNIIANEMNAKFIVRTGGSLSSQKDIFLVLEEIDTAQTEGIEAIFFIDEIHKLATKDMPEELWYSILEDFIFFSSLAGAKLMLGSNKYYIKYNTLKTHRPFTIIGATTSPGNLNKPLRDRFTIHCYLKEYSVEDLVAILKFYAEKESIKIKEDAKIEIAKRARGVPRIVINYLRSCRDRTLFEDKDEIDVDIVKNEMKLQGIEEDGLTRLDLIVLETLAKNPKGMGLQNLAGTANIDQMTLQEMVLSFLQSRNLTKTTTKRFITNEGIEVLKKKNLFS